MTAASDAAAKSTLIWKAASQYEINRDTWSDSFTEGPQKRNIFVFMMLPEMNSKCLVMEWKIIWQNLRSDYQKGFYQKRRLGWLVPLNPKKVR